MSDRKKFIKENVKRQQRKYGVVLPSDVFRDAFPNLIDVLSFEKMEGLDYTEKDVVFWVLGCPNVKTEVIEERAKVIYGNDTKPLCYEYDKEAGTYVDDRLQKCWQEWVSGLLTQATGRARLNRLANTVIVFSNVLIPDFTGRAVGFVPEDLEVAAGLDNLAAVAKQRIDAEKTHKTARQKRTEASDLKAAEKAEQKNTVYRLYNAGVPPDEIKERVGISRRTVFNWLDDLDF